jgi:hypothetical protein
MDTTDGVKADSDRSVPIKLDEYKTVLRWVVDQAQDEERQPSQVEQALYRLSQMEKLKLPRGTKRTWADYGRLAGEALASSRPVPKASGHESDKRGRS